MPSLIQEDLAQPGTHAFIIGVSEYLHLEGGHDPTQKGSQYDMGQLTAAARSASEFAAWLLNVYANDQAPLKSLRVLLSPSPNEEIHPDIAALLVGDYAATRDNVAQELGAFQIASDSHVDNVVIVYVAGHGVQLTKNGAIVLLHDFAADRYLRELDGAIDMAGVHAGMNHPGTAKTQFWFVDACRQKPAIARKFESLTGAAISLDVPNLVTETSPIFYAATTGSDAYARIGGTTLFCEALQWVLAGNGATGPEPDNGIDYWHISVTDLIKKLPDRVRALAAEANIDQSVYPTGNVQEAVFHKFEITPSVNLKIELIPEDARTTSRGTLKQNATIPIIENFDQWPIQKQVDAGLYLLNIEASAPFVTYTNILQLKPPVENREISVNP